MNVDKSVYLKCDCHAETLVFTKTVWDNIDHISYEFSIEDSYCGRGEFHGVLGRFKRAWRAFWAKPVYYNSILLEDRQKVEDFLRQCTGLVEEL